MYTIVIDELAQSDINEIAIWYRLEGGSGLSERFLEEIHKALDHIREFPHSYPVQILKIRRILVNRFPYKIMFFEKKDVLHVIAVIHTSRHASVWKSRI